MQKLILLFLFAFTAAASAQTCILGPFAETPNLGFKLPFLNQCGWGIQGYNPNFTDLDTMLPLKAPLASPALTGVPTVPTAAPGTNSTQIASTAFVFANAGGGGSVSSFSAGDLSPLFTTSEATPTTTPALTFTPSAFAAHTFYGNNTGSSATPGAQAIAEGDVTSLVTDLAAKQATSAKGVANGYPSLDVTGKIPLAQIPAGITGTLQYQGVWNATTNSPTITSGVGTTGFFYLVQVAGSTSIDGHSAWNIGDMVLFNGATWNYIDNTDVVSSVAGRTGAVVLTEADIASLTTDLGLKANLASPTFTGTVGLPASQTLTTPTIASFTNATHNHSSAAGGGQLGVSAVSATGTPSSTTFWRGDNTWSTAGTSSPGGSTTQVQFNDAGSLGGDTGLLYNKTTDFVTAGYLGSKTGPWIDPMAWGAVGNGSADDTVPWQAAVDQMEASGGAIICKGSFKLDRVQLAGQDTIRGVANSNGKGCQITPKTDAAFVNKVPTNATAGPFIISDIMFLNGTNVIDFGYAVDVRLDRLDLNNFTGCGITVVTGEQIHLRDISSDHSSNTGLALFCSGNYARSLFSGILAVQRDGLAHVTLKNFHENGGISGGSGPHLEHMILAEGDGVGELDGGNWTCFFSCTTDIAQFGDNTGGNAIVDSSHINLVSTDHIGLQGGTPAAFVLNFAGLVSDSDIGGVTPCFNGQQATTQMYVANMTNSTIHDSFFCGPAQGVDNISTFGLKFGNAGGMSGTIQSVRGAIYTVSTLGEEGLNIIGSNLEPTSFFAGAQLTDLTNTGIQLVMGNTVSGVNDTAATSSFKLVRGVGDGATYTNDFTSNGTLLAVGENIGFTKTLLAKTAPTVSSGFGTSPSITGSNGSATFRLNVGTGGSATSGVIAMNTTATTGWNCSVNDLTAAAAHVAYNTRQTASSTTTVTVENQTTSTGAAVAWAASDILTLSCFAY